MKKIIIPVIILLITNAYSQDYFKWRVAHEKWVGKDKVIHITSSYLLCAALDRHYKLHDAMIITSFIGLAWEIKDAWIPLEKVGDIGGEGFSITDYMVDNAGVLLYAISTKIYSKMKTPSKKKKIPQELKIIIENIDDHEKTN